MLYYALFKGLYPYRFSGGAGRSAGTSWVGCEALRRFRKFLKGFNFFEAFAMKVLEDPEKFQTYLEISGNFRSFCSLSSKSAGVDKKG